MVQHYTLAKTCIHVFGTYMQDPCSMLFIKLFSNIIQKLHRKPLLLYPTVLYLQEKLKQVSSAFVNNHILFRNLRLFFSSKTQICGWKSEAFLLGALALDVSLLLGHFNLTASYASAQSFIWSPSVGDNRNRKREKERECSCRLLKHKIYFWSCS